MLLNRRRNRGFGPLPGQLALGETMGSQLEREVQLGLRVLLLSRAACLRAVA
jgi:hypothetical protein